MGATGITSIVLIIVNVIVSYQGFKSQSFFDRYAFDVDKILIDKQYWRLITSGFLHVSWLHLIFNMFSLYFFSSGVEGYLGEWQYLVIYFASLIGGDLFSLFVHRHHGDYTSVGASGAVCGIIFASIALFPGLSVLVFVIPVAGWLYGLAFVLMSIYGIRSKRQNIGHEVHLAGALVGMLTSIVISPSSLVENWFTILVVALPAMIFIYIIITRPNVLLIDNMFFKAANYNYTVDQRYNMQKVDKQKEIDRILDKINRSGMKSLTAKEKQDLQEYSKITQ